MPDIVWLFFALPIVPSIALGYVIGSTRGYDEGYNLGYHEGEFDASARSLESLNPGEAETA